MLEYKSGGVAGIDRYLSCFPILGDPELHRTHQESRGKYHHRILFDGPHCHHNLQSPDRRGSPQALTSLNADNRPGHGGVHSAAVLQEQVREALVCRLVEKLHCCLRDGTLSAGLEPPTSVVEDGVGALEVLQDEVES